MGLLLGIQLSKIDVFVGLGVLRAYESLKCYCKKCDLRSPDKITSINMRKYTATIAQVSSQFYERATYSFVLYTI